MPSLQQMFSLPLASPKWRVGEAGTRRGPACSEGAQGLERLVLAAGVRTQRNPAARPTPNEMPGFSQKTQKRGSPGPRSPVGLGTNSPSSSGSRLSAGPWCGRRWRPIPNFRSKSKGGRTFPPPS